MNIEVGNILTLKKPHPCGKEGSDTWKVLRVGADFRLECMGCGHQVMLPRKKVESQIKSIS
ncbi:MAG: DUF951 domain-containing protein [Lachnospiraceae bacterium]|nr:DUF951 domain-containing protein [Lachnospiraceae bacterium]